VKSKYPDVAEKLPKLQKTIASLEGKDVKNVAAPQKFRKPTGIDPFDPNPMATNDDANADGGNNKPGEDVNQGSTIPEYCMMRLIDLTIEPGKLYRYRIKVRMANPNYSRTDVASAAYKDKKDLVSDDWYEIDQTVKVPEETIYYVVDQTKLSTDRGDIPPSASARFKPWKDRPPADTVVMQFQRWIDSTPLGPKDPDPVSVGDWAIAERVFVARGEFVGRKVKVDIPIWKSSQNAFVLPTAEENYKKKNRGTVPTGIDVNFGQDNSENETILIDFEGGRTSHGKTTDDSRIEVLMLSPEGKLQVRTSVEDAENKVRKETRDAVIKRIEDIRTGKAKE
jgi:hypothetical protein